MLQKLETLHKSHISETMPQINDWEKFLFHYWSKSVDAVFLQQNVFLTSKNQSIDTCNKLFNTLFKPILLYTSEVWGAYDKLSLDIKWKQDPSL